MVSVVQFGLETDSAGLYAAQFGSLTLAPVAQMDRASGFEPVGCVFESRRARFAPLAQPGRATDS